METKQDKLTRISKLNSHKLGMETFSYPEYVVLEAMEQYAKDKAKDFASHLSALGWSPFEKDKWEHPDDNTATTESLYNEYSKQKH